jgi:hypothetical protein
MFVQEKAVLFINRPVLPSQQALSFSLDLKSVAALGNHEKKNSEV